MNRSPAPVLPDRVLSVAAVDKLVGASGFEPRSQIARRMNFSNSRFDGASM